MMDVQCDKCNTEYEFEKERVPPEGLAVKCSQCQHVFKVFREEPPAATNGPKKGEADWKVRQASGNLRARRLNLPGNRRH